jgi:general L-amino acid transport system permease protein
MDDHAFVRSEMAPAREPPGSGIGPVRWMHENLFSGWLNSLLTIVSVVALYGVFRQIFPWFAHSVWNAGSLAECRAIIQETWGEGTTGACLAVIHERWKQFLFGFYPNHLYWRPTLAFALLLVALSPVLFSGMPRRLLGFSVIYPGIAYWLLWGGSILVPVAIYAGFALLQLAYRLVRPVAPGFVAVGAGVVAILVWWIYLAGPVPARSATRYLSCRWRQSARSCSAASCCRSSSA